MFTKTNLTIALCALTASSMAGIQISEFSKLHPSGFAIQVAGGGISAGYYTDDHSYTMGIGGLTFTSEKKDSYSLDANQAIALEQTKDIGFDSYLFIRKNMPVTDNLTFGLGISGGKKFPGSGDTREIKKDYNAQQYVMFEYALTSKVLLGAWINTVNVAYTKTTDGDTKGDNTKTFKIFQGGSVQLTYMIA